MRSHYRQGGESPSEVVGRNRALIKKAPTKRRRSDHDAILEVMLLPRTEGRRQERPLRNELGGGLAADPERWGPLQKGTAN